MTEVQGGFLGLLNVFDHVGWDCWCSKCPCRDPVVEIFHWATSHSEKTDVPTWTDVGVHALYVLLMHTELACREWYRYVGHGGPHVSWEPPQTASLTAFVHQKTF